MRPFTPPPEGLCGVCEATVQVRRDSRLKVHPAPYDADTPIVFTITDRGPVACTNCPGSGEPPAVLLEMTFARWLHAHANRRDAHTNAITYLAQHMFRPCSRTRKTPADVTWSTVDELHLLLHGDDTDCGWQCRYIEQVAVAYAAYDDTRRVA
ncbi:hypothetical protein ACFXDE_01910 [Kitasatospora sp. NPDC059408]|uniref:hypothetical protein n=1 Tax=Kitasatospora sp. NPDC059408 TaxID=3346823 RepID=UPI0036953BA4